MKIYHYTKFDTFIYDILPKMQLKFGSFLNCNDPFEFYQSVRVNLNKRILPNTSQYFDEFEKQIKKHKFLCFSKDFEERKGWQLPTMWAHYGDNHNGVCLEFDYEQFDLDTQDIPGDIVYEKDIPEYSILSNSSRDIEYQIEHYIKENLLLFKKLNHWVVESEYRIIRNIDDDFLKIDGALNCVYLGLRASYNGCKSTKVKILERLFQDINGKIQINLMRDANLLSCENLDDLRFVVQKNEGTL